MKNILIIGIPVLIAGLYTYLAVSGKNCPLCSLVKSNVTNVSNAKEKTIGVHSPIILNENNFESEVLKSEQPVVVDFWAAWCGPCKRLSPIIDELSEQYEGKIKFGKVDVDRYSSLANKYNITSIPHLIIFQNGKVIDHIIGLQGKNEIESKLKSFLQ